MDYLFVQLSFLVSKQPRDASLPGPSLNQLWFHWYPCLTVYQLDHSALSLKLSHWWGMTSCLSAFVVLAEESPITCDNANLLTAEQQCWNFWTWPTSLWFISFYWSLPKIQLCCKQQLAMCWWSGPCTRYTGACSLGNLCKSKHNHSYCSSFCFLFQRTRLLKTTLDRQRLNHKRLALWKMAIDALNVSQQPWSNELKQLHMFICYGSAVSSLSREGWQSQRISCISPV